jgi:molybdate transport system substrate-binding protein
MRLWKRSIQLTGVLALMMWLAAPGTGHAEPLTIAAAPSLKPVLRDILPLFESQHKTSEIRVVYGPSQTLRAAIEDGAPADVFLPAAAEEVNKLQKKGLTLNGGPVVYGQTSLVLATASPAHAAGVSLRDLHTNRIARIAMGDPKTTALGILTQDLLSKLDLGPVPHSRYLYGKHDDVIQLLISGEADVGIVYRIDAAANPALRIIDEAPGALRFPVQFSSAVVWTCGHRSCSLGKEFVHFLTTPDVQKILIKHGFDPAYEASLQAQRSPAR